MGHGAWGRCIRRRAWGVERGAWGVELGLKRKETETRCFGFAQIPELRLRSKVFKVSSFNIRYFGSAQHPETGFENNILVQFFTP